MICFLAAGWMGYELKRFEAQRTRIESEIKNLSQRITQNNQNLTLFQKYTGRHLKHYASVVPFFFHPLAKKDLSQLILDMAHKHDLGGKISFSIEKDKTEKLRSYKVSLCAERVIDSTVRDFFHDLEKKFSFHMSCSFFALERCVFTQKDSVPTEGLVCRMILHFAFPNHSLSQKGQTA